MLPEKALMERNAFAESASIRALASKRVSRVELWKFLMLFERFTTNEESSSWVSAPFTIPRRFPPWRRVERILPLRKDLVAVPRGRRHSFVFPRAHTLTVMTGKH